MSLYNVLKYCSLVIIFLMFGLLIYNSIADNETLKALHDRFEILWPIALLIYAFNELKLKPKDENNVS